MKGQDDGRYRGISVVHVDSKQPASGRMRIVRTDERQLAKDLKGGLSIAANADCDDFARDRSLELIRSPLRDDQTVVDDGQLIAQRVSLFQVMSRQKYRRAPFTQALDLLPEVCAALRVEPAVWFCQRHTIHRM